MEFQSRGEVWACVFIRLLVIACGRKLQWTRRWFVCGIPHEIQPKQRAVKSNRVAQTTHAYRHDEQCSSDQKANPQLGTGEEFAGIGDEVWI